MHVGVRKLSTLLVIPATVVLLGSDGAPLFTEVTERVRLDFLHDPGKDGSYFMPEIMGSGGAFLDYDNDGDLDIYLIQAGPHGKGPHAQSNQLFRQEGDGSFRDVTLDSGLGDTGYGMGVAVGDIDNDGFVDVYVSNYGPDALYRNTGRERFEDITEPAGIAGDGWSSSAALCDYDRDGYLDLYVSHYVSYDARIPCTKHDGRPEYCSPQVFPGEADVLYHNDGDGTFTDVSRRAGIQTVSAPGLGILCQDLTGDGWPDFYVANDGEANQLWINLGNDRFVDEAFKLGGALNSFGQEEAGMGIAGGDMDSDGDLDLFLTHLNDQTNTLYRNDGKLGFQDATIPTGLGLSGLSMTGFGTAFLDVDHDGDLDIALVNGRVTRQPLIPRSGLDSYWAAYAEPNILFRNLADQGKSRFEDVSVAAGPFAGQLEISRGLAVGDVDGDGDLDLLLTNTGGPARLFRNDAEKEGRWLLVRAYDPRHKRDAYGAVVTVLVAGKRIVRTANPGGSYLSSSDPRAHFGLPATGKIERILIRWPDGPEESFRAADANLVLVLRKGQGTALR